MRADQPGQRVAGCGDELSRRDRGRLQRIELRGVFADDQPHDDGEDEAEHPVDADQVEHASRRDDRRRDDRGTDQADDRRRDAPDAFQEPEAAPLAARLRQQPDRLHERRPVQAGAQHRHGDMSDEHAHEARGRRHVEIGQPDTGQRHADEQPRREPVGEPAPDEVHDRGGGPEDRDHGAVLLAGQAEGLRGLVEEDEADVRHLEDDPARH